MIFSEKIYFYLSFCPVFPHAFSGIPAGNNSQIPEILPFRPPPERTFTGFPRHFSRFCGGIRPIPGRTGVTFLITFYFQSQFWIIYIYGVQRFNRIEGVMQMVSYDRLWETMKKANISQYRLIKYYGVSAGQIGRLKKNMYVSTHTIDVLCNILRCNVEDVMEVKLDSEQP